MLYSCYLPFLTSPLGNFYKQNIFKSKLIVLLSNLRTWPSIHPLSSLLPTHPPVCLPAIRLSIHPSPPSTPSSHLSIQALLGISCVPGTVLGLRVQQWTETTTPALVNLTFWVGMEVRTDNTQENKFQMRKVLDRKREQVGKTECLGEGWLFK